MATTYKWVINQMNCVPKEGQMTDVVSVVHWTRLAETFLGAEPLQVSVYGSMSCSQPSDTDFTAYPELTYEQVCSWLEAGLEVSALDLNLDAQIENQVNPPVITLPLPFTNP